MPTNKFSIQGFEQISTVLKKLPGAVVDKEVQTILMRNARKAVNIMKEEVGEHTGAMRKAIKTKRGKFKKDAIDVWAGVQNTKFSRAPHWHLVAYGTDERKIDSYRTKKPTKRKLVGTDPRGIRVGFGGGEVHFVSQTGKMPAKPYADIALKRTTETSAKNQRDLNKYLNRRAKTLINKYKV